ncbi:MAG: fibronectin type III domain-containing protein [bacterium]
MLRPIVLLSIILVSAGCGWVGDPLSEAKLKPPEEGLATPIDLRAAEANGTVYLAWRTGKGEKPAGYIVHYGITPGEYDWEMDVGERTFVAVKGLEVELTYYFAVSSYDSSGRESDLSNEVSVTISGVDLPPEAPTGLEAEPGDGEVELRWSLNPEADVVAYIVYYGTASGDYAETLEAEENKGVVDGLSNGTTYYFAVSARDLGGQEGEKSQEASATPSESAGEGCGCEGDEGFFGFLSIGASLFLVHRRIIGARARRSDSGRRAKGKCAKQIDLGSKGRRRLLDASTRDIWIGDAKEVYCKSLPHRS